MSFAIQRLNEGTRDDRTLRKIGFHRSELGPVAAERRHDRRRFAACARVGHGPLQTA
jgi:hypothetical protein